MTIHKSPIMLSILVLFIALVGATIYRIITALETHPGLVVEDAYSSGERYGNTLQQKNKLRKQGWTLNLTTPETIEHNKQQIYRAMSVKNNKPLLDAKVMVYFYRPLSPQHDFFMPMRLDDNTYKAQVILPLKGRWDMVVEVKKDDFLQRNSAKLFAY